jgi:hypothetical protein
VNRGPRAAAIVSTAIATIAGVGSASAAERVTVVRSGDADAPTSEIATRAWAELNAGGVMATLIQCPRGTVTCQDDAARRGELTLAIVSIRLADETVTRVDVSLPGREPARGNRSTMFTQSGGDAKVIAIRAVELVHAALLEDRDEGAIPAPVPAIADSELPGSPRPASASGPGVSAGAALGTLQSLGGLSGGYGALLRMDWIGPHGFGLLALVSLPMFGPANQTANQGRVSVAQEVIAIEGVQRFRLDARVQPYLVVGGGIYALALRFVDPPIDAPSGTNGASAALLLAAGGGVQDALTDRVALFGELQGLLAGPSPRIRLPSGQQGTEVSPSLLTSIGLQRTF